MWEVFVCKNWIEICFGRKKNKVVVVECLFFWVSKFDLIFIVGGKILDGSVILIMLFENNNFDWLCWGKLIKIVYICFFCIIMYLGI